MEVRGFLWKKSCGKSCASSSVRFFSNNSKLVTRNGIASFIFISPWMDFVLIFLWAHKELLTVRNDYKPYSLSIAST
jgi:hypothetical protein